MRFAFVPFVILAASFSLVAAQTATVPPDVAPNKIDMSKPPAPPTNVNVLNWPELRQPMMVELLDGPLDLTSGNYLPINTPRSVNVDGFSMVGIVIVTGGEDYAPGAVGFTLVSRWSADEEFLPVGDARVGQTASNPPRALVCRGYADVRTLCPAPYGEVKVQFQPSTLPPMTVRSVRVYLFP